MQRKISADLIYKILEEGNFENKVLNGFQKKYAYLPEEDRHFIVRLVKGTVERKLELDYYINRISKTRTSRMKKMIRTILRQAVYEIRYMEGSENYAAVNEAVKLTKKENMQIFAGFVNAVLRNYIRQMDKLIPDTPEAKYSIPQWIIDRFTEELGREDTVRTLEAFNSLSPITIRLSSRFDKDETLEMLKAEGADLEEINSEFNIYRAEKLNSPAGSEAFSQGRYYIQDYSSMFPVMLAGIKKDDRIVDLCAAPGGKSLFAAELASEGKVLALDKSQDKIDLINENALRMGADNILAEVRDATVFVKEFEGRFDKAILDLPCSGLGVIGRKADMRYRIKEEDLLELASLQRKIIDNGVRYVKPGGRLIYSTCTIDRFENEDNMQYILNNYPDYRLLCEKKILPFQYGSDGFYTAVCERK